MELPPAAAEPPPAAGGNPRRGEAARYRRTVGYFMCLATSVAPLGIGAFSIRMGYQLYGAPVVFFISISMILGSVGIAGGALGLAATLHPVKLGRAGTLAASWLVVASTALCLIWAVAAAAGYAQFATFTPQFVQAVWDSLPPSAQESLQGDFDCVGWEQCGPPLFNFLQALAKDRVIMSFCLLFGYIVSLGYLIAEKDETFPTKD
ncbi:hypothetical protein DFJ74DRAFT_767422 [Hyaloraphidium curvatum]|nr:hypothetical protein DFJ74DRAFT_767422 [Hyaloraphidium curvatum]